MTLPVCIDRRAVLKKKIVSTFGIFSCSLSHIVAVILDQERTVSRFSLNLNLLQASYLYRILPYRLDMRRGSKQLFLDMKVLFGDEHHMHKHVNVPDSF